MENSTQTAAGDRIFDEFREIRRRVWSEATLGNPENQRKLREKIVGLSSKARLTRWQTDDIDVRLDFWKQFLDKIFYSGFRAVTVEAALPDIYRTFGDYKSLCSSDWDVCLVGNKCSADSGHSARQYLEVKDGSQRKICHPMKIRKVVTVARAFAEYFDAHPRAEALSFLRQGEESNDVWLLSEKLERIGLSGRLTQLHLMMDLGFDCIKPDVVISRLVLQAGWLADFSTELPSDLQEADLSGTGTYGHRFEYTKDVVIRPIVDLARAFASRIRGQQKALEDDIGWVSSSAIREFDIFMVKYGQKPDPNWGIMKQLG
jgi:hypothetical protein